MTVLFTRLLNQLSGSTLPSGRMTRIYEIHSKKTQVNRTRSSDAFRKQQSGAAILVSSDVSARGVDYPGVTRIIQVGISGSTEQYVHRIGRTGRAGTGGRGDLVLLPWEMGFVPAQLSDMPLKPLTVGDLSSQVQELAGQFDQDPQSFLKEHTKKDKSAFRTPTPHFVPSVSKITYDVEKTVQTALLGADETLINEAFASLLGYYTPRCEELRVDKSAILQGCKDWAVGACALSVPPYISETFLTRLGLSTDSRRNSRVATSGRPWTGRAANRPHRPGTSWVPGMDRSSNRRGSRWSEPSDEDERRPRRSSAYGDRGGDRGRGRRDFGERNFGERNRSWSDS